MWDEHLFPEPIELWSPPPVSVTTTPRMSMPLLLVLVVGIIGFLLALRPQAAVEAWVEVTPVSALTLEPQGTATAVLPMTTVPMATPAIPLISPVFMPTVQRWAPDIVDWAAAAGVDPNLAAIIMQIESCGDKTAISIAGAQSLFQVMPFHFTPGENMQDPDTNARRGLAYFAERLVQTNGDIGRAFAGYNGGHVAAAADWDQWAAETRAYYRWSTGILADIDAGLAESPTLQAWLAAGGASLCRQAAAN